MIDDVQVDEHAYLDAIIDVLETGLSRIGDKEVPRIQEELDISCPVYHEGRGSHSPPGDPPYRETGALQAQITYSVDRESGLPVLNILSSRLFADDPPQVPQWLEEGTQRMAPRPYMRPAMERLAEYSTNTVAEAMEEGLR